MALTRGVPAGLITALSGHFHPVVMAEADWPSEMIRVHTGRGTIAWDSRSWLGTGRLVQFAGPQEGSGISTSEATIRVAETVETMLADRGKLIRNRDVTVWFGATTTPAGATLVAAPVLLFTGYFDSRTFVVSMAGEEDLTHDMVLGLGIGPGARSKASITHGYEDQMAAYPGDTAGRQVQNAIKRALNPAVWPEP